MTRKQKKLGVKTSKSAVFDDETYEEVQKAGVEEISDASSPEPDLNEVCQTLDKLTLDLLLLMEYQMQHKVNIEKSMTDGELHLSKARYIMGHKNVTTLQLPTENSFDIQPSLVVEENAEDDAMFGKPRLNLLVREFTKPNAKDDTELTQEATTIPDPLKWFGVLVPRDLRSAKDKFKEATSWAVDCANTQIRIHQICIKIKQMTLLKTDLELKNKT